jgi:phage terminase large subunit-like protein
MAADLPMVHPEYAAAIAAAKMRLQSLLSANPWHKQRRDAQMPPAGDWRWWLIMAGRGFGKTRTGAEFVREEVMEGRARRVALVGATAADVRDVMIEGESGLLAVCERYGFRPKYEPSKRKLTFPNGAVAKTYSAEEPNRLRGPQHDLAWPDEIAAWENGKEAWDQLQFGLRLGQNPRGIATTTPRPVPVVIDLMEQTKLYYDDDGKAIPTDDPTKAAVVVTAGSTYENLKNLAPPFAAQILRRYEGTRLGRQEIAGELLLDVVGALWSRGLIDHYRMPLAPQPYDIDRIVIGVDPMTGDPEKSNQRNDDTGLSETGIVVCGVGPEIDFTGRVVLPTIHANRAWMLTKVDAQQHGYVLDDRSMSGTPLEWATSVVEAFHDWNADMIIAEINNGGLMVEQTIRQVWPAAPIRLVTASRGKKTRAEPVSALMEKGWIHHVGVFEQLEAQMVTYDGSDRESPDRMDAMVWAFFDLMVEDMLAELDLATMERFTYKGRHHERV